MRRRRRRTITTQRIARVATVGMPYPVRAAAGTRLGSLLLVLGLPLLLVTGIMTIEWDSNGPRFRFHRERAEAISDLVGADAVALSAALERVKMAALVVEVRRERAGIVDGRGHLPRAGRRSRRRSWRRQ